MKILFSLFVVVLFSYLNGCAGQEADRKFEAFLNKSLADFPLWLDGREFLPMLLNGNGTFSFNTSDSNEKPEYELTGEIKNRFYHGAEKNISATHILANLSANYMEIIFSYGDAKTDYVQGQYSVEGTYRRRDKINGTGNFTKTNRSQDLLSMNTDCRLSITPKGHFSLSSCGGYGPTPKFDNFTLNGLESDVDDMAIIHFIRSWYDMQFRDSTDIFFLYTTYMREVFANVPVDEIIGNQLPPTLPQNQLASEDNTPTYKSNSHFDRKTNQWIQKSSMQL